MCSVYFFKISIHALREEGDRAYGLIYNEWFRFLSTPSARRATGRIDYETHRRNIFLSTPSARRATQQPERMGDRHQISIHALREEGDQKGHTERRRQAISIHALREEGDIPESYTELDGSVFLSTPSARRATFFAPPRGYFSSISIHALREEGDIPESYTELDGSVFLSTPSARRATSVPFTISAN